jgi:hypothetical protein
VAARRRPQAAAGWPADRDSGSVAFHQQVEPLGAGADGAERSVASRCKAIDVLLAVLPTSVDAMGLGGDGMADLALGMK